MLEFTVPPVMNSMCLRDFLRKHQKLSLTLWRKVKQTGTILVNQQSAEAHTIIYSGDVVSVSWPDECLIPPSPIPLRIYYEDQYLLIVDKPAAMLTHPTTSTETNTLANAVMHYYWEQHLEHAFHPVHRLDRNTSGLILIAKTSHIQHLLSQANHKPIKRLYLALATGVVHPVEALIDKPIGRHPESIIERIIHPDGQTAKTYYKTLMSCRDASLLELEPLTGRTHQIRVHLSSIGHPLLGDDLYGGSTLLIARQALHSFNIEFIHPMSGKNININCPLPADILHALGQITREDSHDAYLNLQSLLTYHP